MPKCRRLAILCDIILLSSLLLLYQLDAKSLWTDELSSVGISRWAPRDIINWAMQGQVHPPLHRISLGLWGRFMGNGDFALRFYSALAGLLGLTITYRLGRILFRPTQALITMYLLAISPLFVMYARMARYFAPSFLLGMISCCLFLTLLRLEGNIKRRIEAIMWLAYILVSALLLYTDYPTSLVVLCQNIFLLVYWKKYKSMIWKWASSQLVLLVLYLPWIEIVIHSAIVSSRGVPVDFGQGALGYLLKVVIPFYAYSVGETILPWHPAAIVELGLVLILVGIGLLSLIRHWTEQTTFVIVFLFLPLAVLVIVFSTAYSRSTFLGIPSRALYVLPFFYLTVARGILSFRGVKTQMLLLLSMTLLNLFPLRNYFRGEDFLNPVFAVPAKEMVDYVASNLQAGDVVISPWDSVFAHYYLQGEYDAPHFFSVSSDTLYPQAPGTDEAKLYIENHKSPRIWLITLGRDSTREARPTEFIEWLNQRYQLKLTKGYTEQDDMYRRIKEMLLHRPAYQYKATVQLCTRR